MNYKGYKCRISVVYKLVRDKKLYSLEIYKDNDVVFKTDFIYENEKVAYKDAKLMIKLKRFDAEIIRSSINKNNLKNDKSYRCMKLFLNVNSLIILSIIGMLILYFGCLFDIGQVDDIYLLFNILYVIMGIVFSLGMLIYGVYSKGEFIPRFNPIIFVDDVKGWYSSASFIALIFQGFIGTVIIYGCFLKDFFGGFFWCVIVSYILLILNYILCVMWEILDAKIKGKGFPFKRIFSPIYTVIIITLFILAILSISL